MTDYYKILGIEHDASDEDIRKAYRKMSRKYHPDIAGAEFEDKFKEVNTAYEVLSDPQKRRMVDMGVDPLNPSSGAASSAAGAGFADMGDLFGQFFSGSFGSQGPIPRVQPGQDCLADATIDLKTAIFGGNATIRVPAFGVCKDCGGSGSADQSQPVTCPQCHGSGFYQKVMRTMLGQVMSSAPCDRCEGHGNVIENPCANCHGHGRVRTIREVGVNVPAGIREDSRLRLSGQGSVGECAGPAGDLYVDIHIRPDKLFTRDGDNLHCWITIPMTWAMLGHNTSIETFDGKRDIEIPEGAQYDDTITLEGLGACMLRSTSQERGDLIIHVRIETPTKLNDEQRQLIERFQQSRDDMHHDVHQHAFTQRSQERKGFFSKLKDAFVG